VRAGRADRGERARDARGMRVILASMARGGERGARGASTERITRENTAQPNRHSNRYILNAFTTAYVQVQQWQLFHCLICSFFACLGQTSVHLL